MARDPARLKMVRAMAPRDTVLLALNETEPEALALLLTTGARPFFEGLAPEAAMRPRRRRVVQ